LRRPYCLHHQVPSGQYLPDYTMQHPRRQPSSNVFKFVLNKWSTKCSKSNKTALFMAFSRFKELKCFIMLLSKILKLFWKETNSITHSTVTHE
jgi:hypothetical protein